MPLPPFHLLSKYNASDKTIAQIVAENLPE